MKFILTIVCIFLSGLAMAQSHNTYLNKDSLCCVSNTATANARALYFAVPSKDVKGKVDSLKEVKKDTVDIWIPTVVPGLNVSQIAFSNWTQGGANSLSWIATVNLGLDYKGKKWIFQNHANATYGRTKLGSENSITTDNQLFIEDVLTYNAGWSTNPFLSNSILTDITTGYSYSSTPPIAIADFFDPGYVTQSIGFGYSKVKGITTRFGIAVQEVFATKYCQFTGNQKAATTVQPGVESDTKGKLQITNNTFLTSRLTLFSRFDSLSVWDVRWNNVIVGKINSIINVNFDYQLVYQKAQSLTTQMKEGLQLGLTYKIF